MRRTLVASITTLAIALSLLVSGSSMHPTADAQFEPLGDLYWTEQDEIRQVHQTSGLITNVIGGLSNPYGIDVDLNGQKIYWTEASDPGKVRRANAFGSGLEELVSAPEIVTGLALDVGRGRLYWAQSPNDSSAGEGEIRSADLDGSNQADVVVGLGAPQYVALDASGGKIYWTDAGYGGSPKIQRANLDGSGLEDLPVAGLVTPMGIAVDPVGGKIYWTDMGADTIRRANLDGSSAEDIHAGFLDDPISIAVDQPKTMYWTENGSQPRIVRSNLDGGDVQGVYSAPPQAIGLALTATKVGGFTELPGAFAAPLTASDTRGPSAFAIAGVAAAGGVAVSAVGGAAWYARRRRPGS